jgi:hypothetical protein
MLGLTVGLGGLVLRYPLNPRRVVELDGGVEVSAIQKGTFGYEFLVMSAVRSGEALTMFAVARCPRTR